MAGLLDVIKEKAKQQYQQGLLNQILTNPASIGTEIGQLFDPAYMSQVKPMSQEGAMDVALSAPMMAGITAFQGSPKLFEKFDKSKIGSGSGMDYGYGGYFSESPSVASQYMGDADKFITTVDNKIMDTPVLQSIIRMGGNPDSFIKSLSEKLKLQEKALKSTSKKEILEGLSEYDIAKLDYNSTLNKINEAKNYLGKNIQKKREGNLYKVDIPDEQLPYFINWDSAMQTPEVSSILKNAGIYNSSKTGADLYLSAINKTGSSNAQKSGFQKASEYLNSLGIIGNKYTDRTYGTVAKDPTNYVVYNPETIKILERNGLLLP